MISPKDLKSGTSSSISLYFADSEYQNNRQIIPHLRSLSNRLPPFAIEKHKIFRLVGCDPCTRSQHVLLLDEDQNTPLNQASTQLLCFETEWRSDAKVGTKNDLQIRGTQMTKMMLALINQHRVQDCFQALLSNTSPWLWILRSVRFGGIFQMLTFGTRVLR
jgi:hypothetical protein